MTLRRRATRSTRSASDRTSSRDLGHATPEPLGCRPEAVFPALLGCKAETVVADGDASSDVSEGLDDDDPNDEDYVGDDGSASTSDEAESEFELECDRVRNARLGTALSNVLSSYIRIDDEQPSAVEARFNLNDSMLQLSGAYVSTAFPFCADDCRCRNAPVLDRRQRQRAAATQADEMLQYRECLDAILATCSAARNLLIEFEVLELVSLVQDLFAARHLLQRPSLQSARTRSGEKVSETRGSSTGRTLAAWQTQILTDWFEAHLDNPYPNARERRELGRRTGRSDQQLLYVLRGSISH